LSRRRLVVVAVLTAAAVATLLVVTGGSAGTTNYDFRVFGVPTQLTAGQQGLVFARFSPTKGSGAATATTITFSFPTTSLAGTPAADPVTSADCGPASQSGQTVTITCAVGTVNHGDGVKRFVTFVPGSTDGDAGISASVSYDSGPPSAQRVGRTNIDPKLAALVTVDGTSAAGTCGASGQDVSTAPVDTTVLQQTSLTIGTAVSSFHLPCNWGTVGVINGRRGPDGAPQVSSVGGPRFSDPATLKLTFSSLPSKFVLKENQSFDPGNPTVGWDTVVPPCPTPTTMPADPSIDTCLVGYKKGKVIVATLLYRGTNTDPFYN